MQPQSLSFFFPMYNESQNIAHTLDEAERILPELGFSDYEILVIDDGSQDGCTQIVEARARQNPCIHLIRHPKNLGYGRALRTGFTQASKDVVFYTDCDLPIDLHVLEDALLLLNGSDLVIGYRIKRYETLRRAVYSRIYNLLMRLLFNVHVRDVNFSCKLVRRAVIDDINLTAGTVFIDGQLLAESVDHGYRICEMPVNYTPRRFGKSNFDSLQTAWRTLQEMLGYWLEKMTSLAAKPLEDQLTN